MTAVTPAPTGGAFGATLRQLRRQRRLSPSNLAYDARIDRSHISRLESGSRQPSRAMVLCLATALEATTDERDRLLGAAGYVGGVAYSDPLVAELDTMLRDETLPEVARHYLRAAVEGAMWMTRAKSSQSEAA